MEERKIRRRRYQKNWIRAKRSRVRLELKRQQRQSSSSGTDARKSTDSNHLPMHDEPERSHHFNESMMHVTSLQSPTLLTSEVSATSTQQPPVNSPSDVDTITSDSDTMEDKLEIFKTGLAHWASKCNITQNETDLLLQLLGETGCHLDFKQLPKTARCLQKSARHIDLKPLSGLQYNYLGLGAELGKVTASYPKAVLEKTCNLKLSMNIDGLPIFKSLRSSLWPILFALIIWNLK